MHDNLTDFDFTVHGEGSIVLLAPHNDAARGWIDDNLYADNYGPTWWGGSVVIENAYAQNIVDGLLADGFTTEVY